MLRKLKLKDAELMHEWMQDDAVLKGLQPEIFKKKTIADCRNFIEKAMTDDKNCHMAIVNDADVYQGTVSLKMIDAGNKDAEFAIVLRTSAQGHGYAKSAMKDIMVIAFEELGLDEVYWNVLCSNDKAVFLYDSLGYNRIENVSERRLKRAPKGKKVYFYSYKKEEYIKEENR